MAQWLESIEDKDKNHEARTQDKNRTNADNTVFTKLEKIQKERHGSPEE